MGSQSASPAEYGFRNQLNWVVSGALSGIVASLIFGGLFWMIEPDLVAVAIPALYGLDPAGTTGWTFHLLHGLFLGMVFGFLVTREPILGKLIPVSGAETIANIGLTTRFIVTGLIYGIVIWVFLPLVLLPIWLYLTGIEGPGFPAAGVLSLTGHVIFGLSLGFFFSIFIDVDPEVEKIESSSEDSTESSSE